MQFPPSRHLASHFVVSGTKAEHSEDELRAAIACGALDGRLPMHAGSSNGMSIRLRQTQGTQSNEPPMMPVHNPMLGSTPPQRMSLMQQTMTLASSHPDRERRIPTYIRSVPYLVPTSC